ncbi:MAG: hypothetical protein K9H49_15140 [Bacteroidales bacterium]|nr:hypothetical protein [Bacteroidales bacterium]MCF8390773.1 hypothetical protein [Bacteroidales bacterium]
MKPYQILLFFTSTVIVLFTISLIFPENGIKISEDINLKFLSFNELINSDKKNYADISNIIENSGVQKDSEVDTLAIISALNDLIAVNTIKANADSLKRITHLIEFPAHGKKKFYRFFSKLENLRKTKSTMRILHYGDSQIETDRMTGYIRNSLQKRFGGSGPGMIPPVPLFNGKMSIRQENSNHWNRYTGFGIIDSTRAHNRYGALISYCSYNPLSTEKNSSPSLQFRPSTIAYTTARNFNTISLYMAKSDAGYLSIKSFVNDSLAEVKTLKESVDYYKINWNFNQTPNKFSLEFEGQSSPELYGISFDNSWGLAMDNIPLRGSAGLVFSKSDTLLLRKMYDDMNVGLIILQFGGNVVPYMKNFKHYEGILKRELKVLKSVCPDAAILVVGPSDMSIKEKGQYVSYPSLEKVRNAIRNASLDSGCAFWDMYEAMGGKNSMPSWVFADPPLAISDFVHFNSKGAKIIAEMMCNAIMYEYNLWELEGK